MIKQSDIRFGYLPKTIINSMIHKEARVIVQSEFELVRTDGIFDERQWDHQLTAHINQQIYGDVATDLRNLLTILYKKQMQDESIVLVIDQLIRKYRWEL